MSSPAFSIPDDVMIFIGHEAKQFVKKNKWSKGRTSYETIKNRFTGNCRGYIFSRAMECELNIPKKEQGWTYEIDEKKYLIKPYYKTPAIKVYKDLNIIGDKTSYLTEPEFDFIALVYYYRKNNSGFVKAIISKEDYLNNIIIKEYNDYEMVFLERSFVDQHEF